MFSSLLFCILDLGRTLLQHCTGHTDSTPLSEASGNEALHINVLVTSGSLIPSLVKCLLFKLDSFFTPENGLLSYSHSFAFVHFSWCCDLLFLILHNIFSLNLFIHCPVYLLAYNILFLANQLYKRLCFLYWWLNWMFWCFLYLSIELNVWIM